MPNGPHDRFVAAFRTEEDGEFDPVRFIHGVARAAEQRGARVHSRSSLSAAWWTGSAWEARVNGGLARARTLVIATNAYAPQLCPALTPLIAPRRGQMLATGAARAPDRRVSDLRAVGLPVLAAARRRPAPDRRLARSGPRWRDRLRRSAQRRRSRPASSRACAIWFRRACRSIARWAGTMGFARDGRPLVGWLDAEHHLAISAGFTGHGLGMAAACSLDLCQLLTFKPAPGSLELRPRALPGAAPHRVRADAAGRARALSRG